MKISIESNIQNYDVIFEDTFKFIDDFQDKQNPIFVIDEQVYKLYRDQFKSIPSDRLFLFDAIEENKTFSSVTKIYDFLISKHTKRNSTFISIGGGITQDITGFVAATFYRGINWIFVPTTFLAMTDSCIGSKTSINYNKFKNLMGTFYPPRKIHINKQFLQTLSKVDFYSGIGETLKFQLMEEVYPKDFTQIKSKIERVIQDETYRDQIIFENMEIKQKYMDGDEFDLGRRNLLNYGHCFGHAIEASSEYYVPHGIAVNIGMIFSNCLSVSRGLLSEADSQFVNNELLLPYIPLQLREKDFDKQIVLKFMKNDKKRTGQFLSVIIPDKLFRMIKLDDVTDKEYENALNLSKKIFMGDENK